jgi:hypothetical protein
MGLDDGPADRQTHSHAVSLGGVERLEQLIEQCRIEPRAAIPHGHKHAVRVVFFRGDQ